MKDNTTAKKVSKIDRLINGIEAVCNKLPPTSSPPKAFTGSWTIW